MVCCGWINMMSIWQPKLNELRELLKPLADEPQERQSRLKERALLPETAICSDVLSVNLLSNAIKYSPDNTCTAIHLERDSDCVNVMITNTMSGQVPANLERLFDRFYRADSSRFYNRKARGWDYQLQGRSFMLTAASCQQNSRGVKLCSKCAC